MKNKLLIWGASGHALVVSDIVRLQNEFDIYGYFDDIRQEKSNSQFCGRPVFHDRKILPTLFHKGVRHAIIAFGNCPARLELAKYLKSCGFILVTVIHPSAIISGDVTIGEGTVVGAGAVINPSVIIGKNVIINTSASIDHECFIEDGVHICPGGHLAGRVVVGRGTWIGIGTTIIDKVHIGSNSFIGAGSVVISDIPDNVLAYGVPARVIRGLD